jgi:hypothetical protein
MRQQRSQAQDQECRGSGQCAGADAGAGAIVGAVPAGSAPAEGLPKSTLGGRDIAASFSTEKFGFGL